MLLHKSRVHNGTINKEIGKRMQQLTDFTLASRFCNRKGSATHTVSILTLNIFLLLFCTALFSYCIVSSLKGSNCSEQKPTKKCCGDKIQ